MIYHNPVMLNTSVRGLVIDPNGIYVDATFGGGGHSRAILEQLDKGRLLSFDQDADSEANIIQDDRFQYVSANFRHLTRFLQYHKAYPVNGILADLGISSHQIDTPERGFSYREDGILDMRMSTRNELSAKEVVNKYDEAQLSRIFYNYGELSEGKRLARQIIKMRENQVIDTTFKLSNAILPCLPKGKENKYLSKIFQAIRIEVNDEMKVLEEFLLQTADALVPGGRLVVIAYHSLEDRIVKNYMRSGNLSGEVEKDFFGNPLTPFRLVTRKALVPDEKEINSNPRARSAKLRIAEKINITKNGFHNENKR